MKEKFKEIWYRLKLSWKILTEKQYRVYLQGSDEDETRVCQPDGEDVNENLDRLIMGHLLSTSQGVAFDIGVFDDEETGEEEYMVIMRSKSGWYVPIKTFKHRQPKKALQSAKDLLYKLNYNYG